MEATDPRERKCKNCGNEFLGVEDSECHICGGEAEDIENER